MKDSPYSTVKLKERTLEELIGLLAELKKELFDARIMQATSQLKDVNQIKKIKRNIARVMTEISDRKNSARKKKVENE